LKVLLQVVEKDNEAPHLAENLLRKEEKVAKRRITKAERERIGEILNLLDANYSTDYKCYLNHETPWQLLIATILSAQCTDERVNIVTKDLFEKYKSLEDFANADIKELEKDIHSTGFYHNKAKNIIECADKLVKVYKGEVPKDIEALTGLAGVGRKTANVIRGNIYHEPSIVVDTHVKRISNKLGFTKSEDPVKIEYELMELLPRDHWILYNIQIITHGRTICTARNPKCNECFLHPLCKWEGKL
jgi:endonuclease III